jgi:transcriptional regulator NrdR family protein
VRRRRVCGHCEKRFYTYEIDGGIWNALNKVTIPVHVKALAKATALAQRNEQIVARLRAGEKHVTIAADFALSDNMVSTIAARAGISSKRKQRGEVPVRQVEEGGLVFRADAGASQHQARR